MCRVHSACHDTLQINLKLSSVSDETIFSNVDMGRLLSVIPLTEIAEGNIPSSTCKHMFQQIWPYPAETCPDGEKALVCQ